MKSHQILNNILDYIGGSKLVSEYGNTAQLLTYIEGFTDDNTLKNEVGLLKQTITELEVRNVGLQEVVDDQNNLMGWAKDELKRVGNGKWKNYYSLPMNLSTHIETVLKDLQHAAKHRSGK